MTVHCTIFQKPTWFKEKKVKALVKEFLKWKKTTFDEVYIHFVNKKHITKLHKKYFQDATPTDCITLPIDSFDDNTTPFKVLGEIFICPEVAEEYSKKHQTQPKEELSLYIVHGLLHLLGFKDTDKINKSVMRKEEKISMQFLRDKNVLL